MKKYSKRALFVAIPLLALVLAGGITAIIATGVLSSPDGGKAALQPASVITIAGKRYVSPCKALPATNVHRIFGKPKDTANFNQTYFEKSLSKQDLQQSGGSVEVSCNYGFGDDAKTTLGMSITYYATPAEAKARWQTAANLGSGATTREIEQLPRNQAFNDSFFDFIQKLNAENIQESGAAPLPGLRTGVLFQPGQGDFLAYKDNAFLRLRYYTGGQTYFDKSRKLTELEANKLRDRVNNSFGVVFNNFNNKSLDQSPASAQYGSESTYTNGAIYLEPCAISTASTFKTLTGQPQVRPTFMSSMQYNTVARREANNQSFYKSSVSNCERTANVPDANGMAVSGTNYGLTVSVRYAPSKDAAPKMAEDYVLFDLTSGEERKTLDSRIDSVAELKQFGVVREIKNSTADSLYILDNGKFSSGQSRFSIAYFTVNSYVVRLTVDPGNKNTDQERKVLTDEQYKQAVDQLVTDIHAIAD